MNYVLVRVDNRLVHGQILEAWIPFLKASQIIVVDDEVASDFFRETVIKMAVPSEVEVKIKGVEDFVRDAIKEAPGGTRTIVLFSNIWDALRAYALGFVFDKINIGNIYNEECRHKLSACVLLSDEDLDSIRSLLQRGVNIEVRRVPRERPVSIAELLKPLL
ncbi:MAG TPA: PTS sugar transporter subunit IIB [Syntrophales bacterium]|jgi:PTS system mannose-specific IIB component|nr:PTS sugar transporter subunit IIB [Syntrophales bacterium]HON22479.1 PTS sugar transporter subunit IIB [Syntrophales bacterium]HOU76597.1 PTS sugar transporter subunit IIB [Syntrophales bacterium]HPC31354.1 PTS sugar transporter subunit IIB [Syntrophales bacterium]HQG33260.1 PTS sugar transporter subunit IIB [Syntrophales bacterium]